MENENIGKQRYMVMLVENNAGVLARISSLFCQRGFNINSLNVAETDNPHISRITVVTHGDEDTLRQIIKQTTKLVEAQTVYSVEEDTAILRELLLMKLRCEDDASLEMILAVANNRNAKVVDVSDKTAVVEFTGTEERVDALIRRFKEHGAKIVEMCRTGVTAIEKGKNN